MSEDWLEMSQMKGGVSLSRTLDAKLKLRVVAIGRESP